MDMEVAPYLSKKVSGAPAFEAGPRNYQLDLVTPVTSPFEARDRKQIRQTPNLRRKARGRPQMLQRLYIRTSNLGFRLLFAIRDFLATVPPLIS
jgi:hypothetical protein